MTKIKVIGIIAAITMGIVFASLFIARSFVPPISEEEISYGKFTFYFYYNDSLTNVNATLFYYFLDENTSSPTVYAKQLYQSGDFSITIDTAELNEIIGHKCAYILTVLHDLAQPYSSYLTEPGTYNISLLCYPQTVSLYKINGSISNNETNIAAGNTTLTYELDIPFTSAGFWYSTDSYLNATLYYYGGTFYDVNMSFSGFFIALKADDAVSGITVKDINGANIVFYPYKNQTVVYIGCITSDRIEFTIECESSVRWCIYVGVI